VERGRGFDFEHWGDPSRFDRDPWWEGPLEVLLLALAVALLVVAVVWVVRRLSAGGTAPAVAAVPAAPAATAGAALADPAVEVLRMRYARGEVDREQFRRTLEDLAGGPPAWPGEPAGDDTAPTAA
jgi:hypothetical protein